MDVNQTAAAVEEIKTTSRRHINNLPDVVLEYIFSHLSPYDQINDCRLVCQRWNLLVATTHEKLKRDFAQSLTTSSLSWSQFAADDRGQVPAVGTGPSCRYSHSSCRFGKFMYTFGGSSANDTTFNDLWTFNLTTRSWKRIVAGSESPDSYPQPKRSSSLLLYGHKLILFGGMSRTSLSPMNQGWKIFNDVHEYDTERNTWLLVKTANEGPFISAHSACIMGHKMIVFGGLVPTENNPNAFRASDEIWTLDLQKRLWTREPTLLIPKPPARYGHSMMVIDEKHLLVLGGCSGPNTLFNDAWLLCLAEPPTPFHWRKVIFKQQFKDDSKNCTAAQPPTTGLPPFIIGLHQACKIGDKIIILNKSSFTKVKRCPSENSKLDEMEDQAGKKIPLPKSSNIYLGPSIRPNARKDRQKLLEGLNRMEQKIRAQQASISKAAESLTLLNSSSKTFRVAVMAYHIIDLSELITERHLIWYGSASEQESEPDNWVPQQRQLYSLIAGKNEAILFGGIGEKDNQPSAADARPAVYNSVHTISAKRIVI